MDYKTQMDADKKNITFAEVYEEAITNKQKLFSIGVDLAKQLHDKREFGLKKYGEHSFQANFENCMTSPTIEHASEELIDCLNYLLHEQYKNDLHGVTNEKIIMLTKKVIDVYLALSHT